MGQLNVNQSGLITLKHDNCFAVFDTNGDIALETGIQGLYVDDMRFHSRMTLTLGEEKPYSVGSQVTSDNSELIVRLTNPEMIDDKGKTIPAKTIHITRRMVVCDGLVHQAITIQNNSKNRVQLPLNFQFESDFLDKFVVFTDFPNPEKPIGTVEKAHISKEFSRVTRLYNGLDEKERTADIFFSSERKPDILKQNHATFSLDLEHSEEITLYLEFGRYKEDAIAPSSESYKNALNTVEQERKEFVSQGTQIKFSNPQLQRWFDKSLGDLALLINNYDSGPYPCAGVPWFAVPFGRDGIITAMEMLWARPEMAKGVLKFLSERQATEEILEKEAEPGKIIHETRQCEMANLGMVPYGMYYGGVDTTLLYIILAGEYLNSTEDRAFIEEIWPNIEAALQWIEDYAEDKNWPCVEDDGFIVYQMKGEAGLINQMWKDSVDAVYYEDGNLDVKFPRAVCEVQGYAYAAWKTGQRMAALFGDTGKASYYEAKAENLRQNFNEKFWDKKDGFYVLALDGDKEPCRIRASNMGHLLFTGIVHQERVKKVVDMLMEKSFSSGFGIRTVPEGEVTYNPQSYHNGAIWPHDTAMIQKGMGETGYTQEASQVFQDMFRAAEHYNWRLPELFSGFAREKDFGPTDYPRACAPQAWAAAVPFQGLQAMLGLKINAEQHEVRIDPNNWPCELGTLTIENLQVGDKTASFMLAFNEKHGGEAVLHVLSSTDEDVKIIVASKPQGLGSRLTAY